MRDSKSLGRNTVRVQVPLSAPIFSITLCKEGIMSLNVYFDTAPDNIPLVHDVEEHFTRLKPSGTMLDRQLIQAVEEGRYLNYYSFIDRFGFKLRISELSTGCKAALCVANCPDKVIDLIECNMNAICCILRYATCGNVLIHDPYAVVGLDDVPVDLMVFGTHFTSGSDYNKYMTDVYPLMPDEELGFDVRL